MKIGIVSFAHVHAMGYLDVIENSDVHTFVGALETDERYAKEVAGRVGDKLHRDWDSFLATGPDAVVICSENTYHARDSLMAIDAGLHVLCEKPLETTAAKARSIVEAAERAGVVVMTAFPMRFSPPLRRARAALLAGEYGRLSSVVAVNQGTCPGGARPWFVSKELAGGGAVTDHTVHLLDVLRWYTDSEVEEVYAVANRIIADDIGDSETAGLVSLRFANGLTASIDCSWSRPSGYPTWGGVALRLATDRGIVEVDAFREHNAIYGGGRGRWAGFGRDTNADMVHEFAAAIAEGRQPYVTGTDGLRAVEVVEAAYRSIESGQPEKIGTDG